MSCHGTRERRFLDIGFSEVRTMDDQGIYSWDDESAWHRVFKLTLNNLELSWHPPRKNGQRKRKWRDTKWFSYVNRLTGELHTPIGFFGLWHEDLYTPFNPQQYESGDLGHDSPDPWSDT